jgi:hypothetical protein
MKTSQFGIFLLAIVALAHYAPALSTQPAQSPLEIRANTAFTQGHYAEALPLLQELAGTLIEQPDRLGPVEERIRVCKRAIASATKPGAAATRPVVDLSAGRTPHSPPAQGQVVDMNITELGNFNFDPNHGGNIPDDVMRLNGVKFRTRGFMIPLDQADQIKEFALVPSLTSSPFGTRPLVQHAIIVHLPPNTAVDYFPNELQVEGTLTVQETKDRGFIVSIFEINATSVKAAPK